MRVLRVVARVALLIAAALTLGVLFVFATLPTPAVGEQGTFTIGMAILVIGYFLYPLFGLIVVVLGAWAVALFGAALVQRARRRHADEDSRRSLPT